MRQSTRIRAGFAAHLDAGASMKRGVMRSAIEVVAAAFLLAGIFAPAKAQDLEGTLKKVKENSTFTIGHRDSSIPLSYLDDKLLPVGFSIELCKHVVDAVKAKLGMPKAVIWQSNSVGRSFNTIDCRRWLPTWFTVRSQ